MKKTILLFTRNRADEFIQTLREINKERENEAKQKIRMELSES